MCVCVCSYSEFARVCVCMCVCGLTQNLLVCVCVCVCVWSYSEFARGVCVCQRDIELWHLLDSIKFLGLIFFFLTCGVEGKAR